jgi:hypothetical protein
MNMLGAPKYTVNSDQLLELERQSTTHPSAIERVRTALIDRDEALQQAGGGLERARSVAAD